MQSSTEKENLIIEKPKKEFSITFKSPEELKQYMEENPRLHSK